MSTFYIVLVGYFSIGLLIVLRLGWHIAFKFDQYDRKYRDVRFLIIFSIFFWPLFFLNLKLLLDPSDCFSEDSVQVEEARLRNNPPPCGERILYHQTEEGFGEACGGFIFDRKDVEEHLREKLIENPNLHHSHEGAILNWVSQDSDSHLSEPTSVPKAWRRFEYVANELIKKSVGEIRCLTCQTDYSPDQLTSDNDQGQPGWNFDRQLCPKGHLLLITRNMHIYMRRPSKRKPAVM